MSGGGGGALPPWARVLGACVPPWRADPSELARCRTLASWTEALRREDPGRGWLRADGLGGILAEPGPVGPGPVHALVRRRLSEALREGRSAVRAANDRYVRARAAAPDPWLEGLNPEQFAAAVSGADRNLVLAAAGTGKTRTMVAKAADLVRRGECRPERIAFITFTRRAASEIRERVAATLGGDAEGMRIGTIHSLARAVLALADGQAPRLHDLTDEAARIEWLTRCVTALLAGDDGLMEAVDERRMAVGAWAVEHDRTEAPRWRAAGAGPDVALRSKAEAAAAMALWSHRIEYRYEAEYPVPEGERDPARAGYLPDFHLPSHDVWLEVLALGPRGDPPGNWTPEERGRYMEDLRWKRALHARNGSRLAEVTAGERLACLRDGASFGALVLGRVAAAAGIDPAGLRARRRPDAEIAAERDRLWKPYRVRALAGEIAAWMDVVRCRRLGEAEVRRLVAAAPRTEPAALARIARPATDRYLARLAEDGRPDHDATIEWAIAAAERLPALPWAAVIVDEHQDTNPAQDALIRTVCARPGADGARPRLWVVGDDWQSIYGFRAADVSLIRDLARREDCHTVALTRTYRFGAAMAATSRTFVLRDPSSIDKELVGDPRAWADPAHPEPVQLVSRTLTDRGRAVAKALGWRGGDGPTAAVLCVLARISRHRGAAGATVMVLARMRGALADIGEDTVRKARRTLERWRRRPQDIPKRLGNPAGGTLWEAALAEAQASAGGGIDRRTLSRAAEGLGLKLDLSVETVHAAKGLEADYVILLDAGNAAAHLRAEERALEAALGPLMPEGARGEAEERRVAYVALTRGRRKVYVVTPGQEARRSDLVAELAAGAGRDLAVGRLELADLAEPVAGERVPCPACAGRPLRPRESQLVLRTAKGRTFCGCSSWADPVMRCGHTEPPCPWCGAALVARIGPRDGVCTGPECRRRVPLCGCRPAKPMVPRTGRDGARFLGCADYARGGCRTTVDLGSDGPGRRRGGGRRGGPEGKAG